MFLLTNKKHLKSNRAVRRRIGRGRMEGSACRSRSYLARGQEQRGTSDGNFARPPASQFRLCRIATVVHLGFLGRSPLGLLCSGKI